MRIRSALLVLLATAVLASAVGACNAAPGGGPAATVAPAAYSSVPSIGVDPAKIAVLAASLVAGLAGGAVLFGPRTSPSS